MAPLRFLAIPTDEAVAFRAGLPDSNGQVPERHISDGTGVPCRHCLTDVPAGVAFLTLAYRPFPAPQPYAETGPIFLHEAACPRYDGGVLPPVLCARETLLIRGYGADDRIVYGTGQVVPIGDLAEMAGVLLDRSDVAYLHVRSASNNCYQCRIERG